MSRRVKALLMSLMPFVLIEVIQFAASLFMVQIGVGLYVHNFHGDTFEEFINGIGNDSFVNLVMQGTYVIYAVVGLIVFGTYYYSHFYKKNHKKYNRLEVMDKRLPELNISFRGYRPVLFVVGVILFVIGMTIVVQYVMSALSVLFPVWLAEFMELADEAGLTDTSVVMVLYVCIIGPMVEELGFRGICTEYLKRGFGFWPTCIIQAVFFGIMHMNAMQASYAFVIGLGLGYVYMKTGNIIITMILHMCYNSFSTLISYIPWDKLLGDASASADTVDAASAGGLGAAVVTFVFLLLGLLASYYGSKILVKSKNGVK